jgi:hypothetical protein
MKESNETLAEWGPEKSSSTSTDQRSQPGETFTAKRLALLQKCDDLIELTEHYGSAYEAVLRALAVANQKSIKTLQDQLFQLRESIPHLEKKFIKRIKLVGTLTDIHKQTQKIKLNPEMARKRDLHKIDDLLLWSCRTLSALNGKRTQR